MKIYNKRSFSKIKIRQCKYGSNIVEQDHRFIKWRIQNGLGFKSFESAKRTLCGIEVVHMLRKNQMVGPGITMFKSFCKISGLTFKLLKILYLILTGATEPKNAC